MDHYQWWHKVATYLGCYIDFCDGWSIQDVEYSLCMSSVNVTLKCAVYWKLSATWSHQHYFSLFWILITDDNVERKSILLKNCYKNGCKTVNISLSTTCFISICHPHQCCYFNSTHFKVKMEGPTKYTFYGKTC